jgi:squalene-associated FAD-dependent desaturase
VSAPCVAVVGGGLAGIAAALACGDAGARVTLLEARPRLGGATFSTRREGLWIDNGQHVFLRCCSAYRGLLARLGVSERVHLQERLAVPVLAPGGRTAWLRRSRLPAPLHLAPSLLRYHHLSLGERLRAGLAARALGALDPDDPALDAESLGSWLAARGQSQASVERFFDLVLRATLNLPAPEASLGLAAMVFRSGVLAGGGAGDLGIPRVPLQALHGDAATRALEKLGAQLWLRARAARIELGADGRPLVRAGERSLACDAVVLAVPHDAAAALLPAGSSLELSSLSALGASPIVNLHLLYDRRVLPFDFAAAVGTPVQWVFDRSAAAGLEARGQQYLALSLSAAEPWVGLSAAELQQIFEPALAELLPAARDARILRCFATCERSATFRQGPGSRRHRPSHETGVARVALAGAWTDTGWPATMEGAVRSGLEAARAALVAAGAQRGLAEVQAA